MRNSFSLLITIILLTIFASLSISIIENKTISSNIDKHKYLYLQSNIHMKYIKNYIQTHTKEDITQFTLDDKRFQVDIIGQKENNQTIYNISIQTIDDTNVRIVSQVIK